MIADAADESEKGIFQMCLSLLTENLRLTTQRYRSI